MHEAAHQQDGADMQYALLIYNQVGDTDALSPEELEALGREYWALRDDPGVTGGGGRPPPRSTAPGSPSPRPMTWTRRPRSPPTSRPCGSAAWSRSGPSSRAIDRA